MKPVAPVPPWSLTQTIRLSPANRPPLKIVLEGWIELEHSLLLACKNQIAALEASSEWELRKKITNPYEAVFSGESSDFPSLAPTTLKPLSRSYFKMIEILDTFGFWDRVPKSFTTAHVCEGPGGFIQATISGALKQKKKVSQLLGMTLKPTKSHIPGWRRSSSFLRSHPEVVLEYGEDGTGNLLTPANQDVFVTKAKGASLFTADGGFDFSLDYSKQELNAFPLLLASFCVGLRSLAQGGTMVIKLFDIYSPATQDLILGSAVWFDAFTLYKPATSRPCNAERYFVAHGFCGTQTAGLYQWIRHLQTAMQVHTPQRPLTRLFGGPWGSDVVAAMKEQILWQEKLQILTIEDTIHFRMDSLPDRILEAMVVSREWISRFLS